MTGTMCDALARADLSGLSGSAMPPDVHEGSGAAPSCVVGSNVPSGAPNRPSSAIRRVLWAAPLTLGFAHFVCAHSRYAYRANYNIYDQKEANTDWSGLAQAGFR